MRAAPTSRVDLALLVAALAAFVALGVPMTDRMIVFSEEFMILPGPPWRVISPRPGAGGAIGYEATCADPGHRRLELSDQRPTLSVCIGARRYPIMAAPYFSALFMWPLETLRPVHHDDPFVIRKILLSLGVLSILLTYGVIARIAGTRLASIAALGIAISPCFVLITSIIQNFEILPWIFLMGAIGILSGLRWLAPDSTADNRGLRATARLALGGFFIGLSVLGNIKALFFIAPIAALAVRLGVQWKRIRLAQWGAMAVSGLVAVSPMFVPVLMDPSMRWAAGRGSSWKTDLLANLQRPEKILQAARDLILLWSNVGYYAARDRINWVSAAVAVGVFAFVMTDTVRVWMRRSGSVVTAACGLIILTHLGVIAFLYSEFPANYMPLHAVYGVALGCAAHRILERVSLKPVALAAAGALVSTFAWNTVQTMSSVEEIAFVTNTRAVRTLVQYLDAHPEPDATTVTVNLLAGGVIDALSHGRIETIQAHAWLGACERSAGRRPPAECFPERWRGLLRSLERSRVVRIVMPATLAFVRRPPALLLTQVASLEAAAAEEGFQIRIESTVRTAAGVPVTNLYRLDRTRPAAAVPP